MIGHVLNDASGHKYVEVDITMGEIMRFTLLEDHVDRSVRVRVEYSSSGTTVRLPEEIPAENLGNVAKAIVQLLADRQ